MNVRFRCLWLVGLMLGLAGVARAQDLEDRDAPLAKARAFVEASDRYLHHSQLKRGMKGYGLSVFAGTTIEKFDVEIVSVVKNFDPGQDVILATCSGQDLETSMIIQGMSGSPVFVTDPRDGKAKMIGAVAYGWGFSKKPLTGIQPITQMIAMAGVLDADNDPDATAQGRAKHRPTPAGASDVARDRKAFLNVVMDPDRQSLDKLYRNRTTMATGTSSSELRPLATPLSVTGCRPETLDYIRRRFTPAGLVPMQGGGAGAVEAASLKDLKLQPGGTLAVPYVMGDADWVGVGTVTEVMGEKVLGFGHGMSGEGNVDFPMGTGYVHTVVPLMTNSFKLGSSVQVVGTLNRDEYVGVGGRVGQTPRMVPMTVKVVQAKDGRSRTFDYQLVKEWYYTGRLASVLSTVSATALREPPKEHHLDYKIRVDFGDFGVYEVANRAGRNGLLMVGRDTELPVAAMMYNPLGEPVNPERIDVDITLREGNIEADIIDARLHGEVYPPGQTVTGTVRVERFRKDREDLPFRIDLPDDLPDGTYTLTVGDARTALQLMQTDQPQRFNPRNPEQLFASLQRVVAPQAYRLHLHLAVPSGSGLAIGQTSLPDLPPSKADMLKTLALPDTAETRGAIRASLETGYILRGQKTLEVVVKKHANPLPLRRAGQAEPKADEPE